MRKKQCPKCGEMVIENLNYILSDDNIKWFSCIECGNWTIFPLSDEKSYFLKFRDKVRRKDDKRTND